MEQAGTVVTDAGGNYELLDVNAGQFTLTVIDPATGDRGKAFAKIETEGQVATADVKMNGQGTVVVTVIDGSDNTVPNAQVTLTALGAFLDTRTANTDGTGKFTFERVAAGDFTVSTRDRPSGLVGTALGLLPAGGTLPITLRLQPVGTINGVVFGVDGSSLQEGVQVRIISRERGIVSQAVTGPDGAFSFNPLPLSDGPYTLDAFADGRLRARVPQLVLNTPNQVLAQNLTFMSVGTVTGIVNDLQGQIYAGATVTLQMTEGLRFAFDTKANAEGRFNFPAVPVGNFTITAAKDGRTGSTQGRVNVDNEAVTANVQLATNSLIGTVFQRDGITPAPGVKVYLVPARLQPGLTIDPKANGVLLTTSNGSGQFGFPIPTTETYIVQAESVDERGRTQVVITTIDPTAPVLANVTFLAKGSVTGMVRDAVGATQPNATIRVTTRGLFTNTWEATSDGSGRYSVPGVFVGDVTTFASNTLTKNAGSATGRLVTEGEVVTLDVTLAPTGRVSGQVLKRDGSVVGGPVKVELQVGYTIATLDLASGSSYQFDLVPVGNFAIVATEKDTGDKGVSNSRISVSDEAKSLNVRLVGQGTVRVSVVDEMNAPVPGTKVTLKTEVPFYTTTLVTTDAAGLATFEKVFAGDHAITASKEATIGTRSGSASGTLIAGQTNDVKITLTSRPTGTVKGTLFGPDGVTPVAGKVIRLLPEPTLYAYRTTTDGEGKFSFANIEGGTSYTLTARNYEINSCDRDRVRAQATGVQVATQDQEVVRNLQMLGAGKVSGKILDLGGLGVGGIRVRLTNPDPVYGANSSCLGTFYETYSGADGSYAYPDIPAGNFTIVAENEPLRTMRGEGSGRVRFDGDDVKLDVELLDNAVVMPKTLYDANAMLWDITGDGSIGAGMNSIFRGSGTETRGMRLEVVVNGVGVPFTNGDGTIGRLALGNQELQLNEDNLASGLKITRKVFVPRTGYFARYLEVLENSTQNPVTIGLRVVTRHSGAVSSPRVVDSSDGDQILSVIDGQFRDRWVVVDDSQEADPFLHGGVPATGHVFDGEGAPRQVGSANYELVGPVGKLTWQWDSITVEPGKSAILMHFAFNQLDRSRAREAALRLAQVPPEALEGLTTDEREAIVNFRIPAEGVDNVAPLPTVNASVLKGRVVSGDGVTAIANATVHVKSKSALYGRDYTVQADDDGAFQFQSRTDGTWRAIAIPLYPFDIDALHPKTGARTSDSTGDFVPPATEVTRDLIFNGTGNVRGTVKRHTGGLVQGARVVLCIDNDWDCSASNYAESKADGSYLLSGSNPRDYFVFATKVHPQQPYPVGEPIRGRGTTTVTAAGTTVTDITMDTTGTVSGIVRAASGDPVENADVTIQFSAGTGFGGIARVTRSDTAGRYQFTDVRVGQVRVEAKDPITGATGRMDSIAVADQNTAVDVTLKGFGTVNVQVNFARGVAAPDVYVYYSGDRSGYVRADAAGKANVAVPVGSYTFTASHPEDAQNSLLQGKVTTAMDSNGQVVDITIFLKAAGAVKGTIVRPDGSTLADGFPYTLKALGNPAFLTRNNGKTNSTGQYRAAGLPPGYYVLTAYDPVLNRFADGEFQVTEDGQEVELNLVLEDNRIALPADLLDANRMRFDVQQSGALQAGHYWAFDQGALKLEVNGTAFTGDTSAGLEAGKRQFAIRQDAAIDGLKVTRKVFVPLGAYFARYLEIFENPTTAPIALDARLSSGYATNQVIGTSSGDNTLTTADTWVMLDDATDADVALVDQQTPALAHVFGQAGAAKAIDEATFTAGTGGKSTIVNRWSAITVPPGGRVALMHFAVQQVNRAGARASVDRLALLPPEAIDSLSESEIQSIVNFTMPQGGVSTVAALPGLYGSVSGRIVEGDGVTGVGGAWATVQSTHPLFNRVWGMRKDPYSVCTMAGTAEPSLQGTSASNQPNAPPAGTYSVAGRLTSTNSIALPEGVETRVVVQEPMGCFGIYAGHTWSHIASREYRLTLPTTSDVGFDSGILTGTITGYIDFQSTTGRVYLSTDNPDWPDYRYVPIAPDGTYLYPGIPPGAYDVLADTPHPQGNMVGGTGLRGSRSGSVVTLGFTTVTDVPLQPAGAVQGAVLTTNGEASVNALVEIASPANEQIYDQCSMGCRPEALAMHKGKQAVKRQTRTDSLGRYYLSAVPAGNYSITVTDPISDGKKTLSLAVGEGQVVVQNVTLLPVATVQLTVYLPSGLPAADAFVYLYAEAQGFEEVAGRTDAAGKLTIANIPQGNYTLRVRDTRRPDDANYERKVSGTITTYGEIQQKTITFLAAATVRVTVVDADNANATVAGATVIVIDAKGSRWFLGTTDASGATNASTFSLPESALTIEVTKTLEGTSVTTNTPASITAADDATTKQVTANVRRTLGSARAIVVDKDANNAPVANADVYVVDARRPTRVNVGRTDGTGQLHVPGVSVGPFTLVARAWLGGIAKETEAVGTITSENIGQTQPVTIELRSAVVPLPRSLSDANAFWYNVQPNGSFTAEVSYSPFNTATSLLEVNGTPFANQAQAVLEAGTRQVTISQAGLAGLEVTRKVYVPREGYFARYLEVFSNPTAAPITIDAKVTHRYTGTVVTASSSGDAAVQPSDHWVTLDDSYDVPSGVMPSAHVQGQAGARKALDALSFESDTAGTYSSGMKVVQSWNQVTVPANGRVALLHFVARQTSRAAGQAAAERLVQLPPEAIDALSPDEIASILNFNVPADGQSAVAPLPPLNGRVQGRVLDGDNTPVGGAHVKVNSEHPLFGRPLTVFADAQGNYSVAGSLLDSGSLAIPTDAPVRISSTRSGTSVPSPIYLPTFPADSNVITQDVIYPTGKVTGRLTGAPDYALTTSAYVDAYQGSTYLGNRTYMQADGTYTYTGLAAGTYDMSLTGAHAQGTSMTGVTRNVVVTVGGLATADIAIEPTGSVTGIVSYSNGQRAARAMSLWRIAGGGTVSRSTQTDAEGRFTFTAVPVGTYRLEAYDSATQSRESVEITVSAGQAVVQNLTVAGTATIQLTVNYARGVPASGAAVYVTGAGLSERSAGSTNASGRLDIAVPTTAYSLRVQYPGQPQAQAFRTTYADTAVTHGSLIPVTVALKALASVRLTVVDADNNNAVVSGAAVTITDAYTTRSAGTTDAAGQVLIANVPEGGYQFTATTSTLNGSVSGSIVPADDNLTVEKTLTFSPVNDIVGVVAYPNEQHIFTLPVTQGQTIAVVAYGEAVGNLPPLSTTSAMVYDVNRTRVAYGWRQPGPSGSLTPYQGNLNSVPVTATGNYTIGIVGPGPTGGYRLKVRVDGVAVKPQAYAGGGSVSGKLMHKRGVPAAGRRVEILTSAYPTMRANVLADANGDYSISGIPTGIQHTLYWSSLDSQPSVYIYYATLAAAGENKAYPTYTLPKEQIITANVRYADGSPAAGVMLSVTGSLYYDFNTYADSSGSRTLYVYGEQPKVAARHPLNDDLQPFYQATGPDGDARSIQLDFPSTGTITGKLTHGGVPIGIAVAAVYGGVGTYAATGKKSVNSSGSTGDFELKGIPVGVTVTLEVAHPDNYNIKLQRTVTIPAPGATVSGQDIEIPLYARVTGRVTMASGSAAWGAVTYTPDGGGWTKTDSLSSGNFVFTGIPPGTSGTLSVAQPVTSVKSTRAVTVPSGTLLVSGQDITLTGVGGITGRFLLGDGTPAAGTYVYAYYTVNSENDTSRAWYTGADGRFTFSANLPVGQPVLLSTYNPHNSYQKLERTVTIQSDGQVLDVGDLQLPPSRTLTVEVRDALDRVPYYSYVTVTDAATGQQVGYAGVSPYSPKYTIRDLTASRVKVVIVNYSPYQEVARTEADVPLGQVTALVVRVSVVNGTVKFDDGTVVPNPALSVYATQQTETGARSYLASTPGNGVYEILGLQPGPFELFAQDTQTALSRVVSGTVPALTSVVTTDVFLPPAGTVTGVVRGPTGAAVSGATVYLRADGLDSYRSASTNASGVYTFARVPVGLVWVESRNASTGAFGSASGTVAGSGQTLTLDIAQVAVANVAGTVKNASGTAASYGTAIVERVQQAQAGLLPVVAYPSASGVYSASAVPGEIRVVAIGSSLTTAGIATYTLEAGGLNGADVTLGNAVSTYSGYNLRSPPPTPYEFYGASCAGAMYTNFETLLVNGVSFPCTRGAYLDAATGEITYGPFKLGDLRVSRRLYAPTSGESFARYVESVTNDSASPLTVEVRLRSTSGYSLTFRPDRRSWVSHGNGTGEAYQEHVIGGAGTVELASVVPQSSATTAVHKWTTTLAPGATAKYMHFVVSRGTTCAAGTKCVSSVAEAVGADLISGADPRAFTGLTDTDRAQIRNFALQ